MDEPQAGITRNVRAQLLVILAGFVALVLIVALVAPYHTGLHDFGLRVLYWGGLMLVCGLSWVAAYAATAAGLARAGVGPAGQQMWASLTAIALFAVPLPFAVTAAEGLVFGAPRPVPFWPIYGTATAISAVIWAFIYIRETAERWTIAPPPPPMARPEAARAPVLARAEIADPGLLVMLEAEDHYLRVHLQDGTSRLIHYRLQQAAEDLSTTGLQVHRSYWVAAHAVTGAERRGRRHALSLVTGQTVPVGDSFLPAVRARGWIS